MSSGILQIAAAAGSELGNRSGAIETARCDTKPPTHHAQQIAPGVFPGLFGPAGAGPRRVVDGCVKGR